MFLPPTSDPQQIALPDKLGYATLHYGPPEEQVLAEVWTTLRRRKFLILGCCVACLLLASLYVLLKSPRYEATARIEVSPAGTNSLGLDQMASRVLSPSDPTIQLQSAVTVLQSNTIALAVMKQLKMAERKDFAGPWVQPAGTSLADLPPEVRDALLLRFGKGLTVEVVPKTDIIVVQFRAKDAALAADVVNSTVGRYTERNFRSSYESATLVSNWLSKQMDDLKIKAGEAQQKLADLQKARGLIGVDETDNIVTEKLKQVDEQLTVAESDRIVKEARYRIAASGNPELIASTVPEPTLEVLRSQQAQLRVDYARLSTKFGEGYPKLAELGNELAQVDRAIQSELNNLSQRYKNEYIAAANTEGMLRANFEKQKQKAFDLNQGAAQYAILKHEVEATQDLYETLQLKLKQAGIVAGLASANIAVVEPGQLPSKPVDPRPVLDLMLGLGVGLGLGLVTAMGLEAVDTTIRTSDEAESVSALPSLAVIPRIREGDIETVFTKLSPAEFADQLRLIAFTSPHSQVAESYRSLRTSLLLSSAGGPPQVLAITSSTPSEGKTLTAINCATVLAQHGAKVLLVDADLRQPSLHEAFNIPSGPGLSAVLAGTCPEDQAMAQLEDMPCLTVLPSGTPSTYPAETLASQKMADLIQHWRGQYDHIVLDTPPLSMFTDAVVLGSRADAALLVVRSRVTTKYALRHSRDLLQRANVNIAGIVLNGVDLRYENGYYRSCDSRSMKEKGLIH
ncbi:MAG: polysaccharide biosynthesis tyrosine autokinase [Candidatus Korobacteraceae bacterium]|jgi:capsular exopolysaccharide synthesis family protein